MIAALFSRFTNSTSPGNLPPVALRHGGGAGVDAPAISPSYAVLLADRANAQAATCAVLDYERKAAAQ
jgi:hypothetical protein